VLHLKKPDRSRWDDRKLDHVRPHLDRAAREGRFGVVAIVESPAGRSGATVAAAAAVSGMIMVSSRGRG
jgi:hypothetical protein